MAGTSNFSLSCQVECKPLCRIVWLKDGAPIGDDDVRYSMSHVEWPENYAKNDFQSVSSMLVFNIEKWRAGGQLNRVIDNANYTCQSTGNLVGSEGVRSTTYFRVECKCNAYLTVSMLYIQGYAMILLHVCKAHKMFHTYFVFLFRSSRKYRNFGSQYHTSRR